MRKSIILPSDPNANVPVDEWLNLERLARVEITSEDPRYPIEAAFIPDQGPGWRAATCGFQTVRLRFDEPQKLRRIWLHFAEQEVVRTQEFVLRWGTADDQPTREVLRQQWVFSPKGSTRETEDYRVDLRGVTVLELVICPDISGGDTQASRASLVELRIA